jgi:GNAT superfamily N-acetyltransferase
MSDAETFPVCPLPGLSVVDLVPGGEPALQAFFDVNPLYFLAVHGVPAQPGEAHEEIFEDLPAGWSYTRKYVLGFEDGQGQLAAMANVVSDLLAPGVWHLGTFIVETARHGSGDAQQLYQAVETWARDGGAGWMRLGVVQGHARAEAFWLRQGYQQVAVRECVTLGSATRTVRVMAKPLRGQTLADYFARVERDRPPQAVPPAMGPS